MASLALLAPLAIAQEDVTPHGGVAGGGYKGPTTVPTGTTVDFTFHPVPYLSFSPNPVGIGQTFLVNVWTTPPPAADRFLAGFKITITKPDNSVDVITADSYVADGTAWFEYPADQVGTWKLKFEFPGEYFPAGRYLNGFLVTNNSGTNYLTSHYYAPAATQELTLTVQQEPVLSWYSPLPTDYWTRPISPENREWYVIAGNFPWAYYDPGAVGAGRGRAARYYGPFITAPNTAHILWRRQGALSGIIGGEAGQYSTLGAPVTPSVIYMGRCYQTEYKPGIGNVAQCYDLQKGEIYYEIPIAQGGVTPQRISYIRGTDTAVPGAGEAATVLTYLLSIGSRLITINPYTGAVLTNVTGLAGADYRYFHNNEFVLTLQTLGTTANPTYRLINWTTRGNSDNFTSRIISNVSWPLSTIDLAFDFNVGIAVQQNRFIYGQVEGGNFVALSLKTGQILWNITTEDTPFNAGAAVADYGKYAYAIENKGWRCFDLNTGKQLWTTEQTSYPWGSFYGYYAASAYGLLYAFHYDGIHAYDWNTGKIAWNYYNPAVAYETPYTLNGSSIYSFRGPGIVADGKLYIHNTEHTPTQPATRGWNFHCINATTGKGLWNITYPMIAGATSNGYLTASSSYDGYMYVFGKGKSAITVTAPQTSVSSGTTVLIQGTVLDQSPAQPGTPCVSKESMASYMEFLHMQKPCPTAVTGVQVTLTALGPDGSTTDIGTTMTNGFYGTFSREWTPPKQGVYTILASFSGDDSYSSSSAATGMSVAPAVQTPNNPEIPTPVDTTMTIIAGVIAIIVAIVVVGLVIILVLRRR